MGCLTVMDFTECWREVTIVLLISCFQRLVYLLTDLVHAQEWEVMKVTRFVL